MRVLRRAPLNRGLIARAALDLLDAEGVSGLTVRGLAHRLGVRAPSLYHHVGGLDDIIDLIQDLVDAEIDLAPLAGDDLADGLAGFARSYRAAFQRHPHALPLVVRRQMASGTALALYDALAAFLVRFSVPVDEALTVMGMLDSLVLGSAIDTFQAGFADAGTYRERYPALANVLDAADRPAVDDAAFEAALALVLAHIGDRARPDGVTRG